jgi:hypothetical protein
MSGRYAGSKMKIPDVASLIRATYRPFFTPHSKCRVSDMPISEDIEKSVEQLAPRELARFRSRFEAFDAERFDAAIEQARRMGGAQRYPSIAINGSMGFAKGSTHPTHY